MDYDCDCDCKRMIFIIFVMSVASVSLLFMHEMLHKIPSKTPSFGGILFLLNYVWWTMNIMASQTNDGTVIWQRWYFPITARSSMHMITCNRNKWTSTWKHNHSSSFYIFKSFWIIIFEIFFFFGIYLIFGGQRIQYFMLHQLIVAVSAAARPFTWRLCIRMTARCCDLFVCHFGCVRCRRAYRPWWRYHNWTAAVNATAFTFTCKRKWKKRKILFESMSFA